MKKLLDWLLASHMRRVLKRYDLYHPSCEPMLRADPYGFIVELRRMVEREIRRREGAS